MKRSRMLIFGGVIVCLIVLGLLEVWGVAWLYRAFVAEETLTMQYLALVHDLRQAMADGQLSSDPDDVDLQTFLHTLPYDGRLIVKGPDGLPCDVWGNPFRIALPLSGGTRMIRVTSSGRDGVFGTGDDRTFSEPLRVEE